MQIRRKDEIDLDLDLITFARETIRFVPWQMVLGTTAFAAIRSVEDPQTLQVGQWTRVTFLQGEDRHRDAA